MLRVPIERADGSLVSDLRSIDDWHRLPRGATETQEGEAALRVDDLVDEVHHRAYGRPWIIGRFRFEFLIAQGLRPQDRVLDFGCGAGRIGVWLIAYLEPERYFGIDAHLRSLVAFSAYEVLLHGLEARRPRLLFDADFRVEHFGERFDVVIDASVTRFLPRDEFRRAFAQVARVLAPGGRVFVGRLAPERLEDLRRNGFELVDEAEPEWPLFPRRRGRATQDGWHVLRRA
jgi:SAM-dependent methyltransferase